ncbi:MAG: phospholipase D-like domain-containing protein [Thermodesulfobacteriota bacterium]|jgi:phosphatidylserine/phosphatidylglycerophosphate/cardiolipin synthase-like enzyme|nr:MAG: phospholipase D-like domain-containing protein [Thermodesulfobacteriota bacterium]
MKNNSESRFYEVHFAGPDMPAFRLRNLLAERIAAVPSGGAIDWVTYYFRDRRLAEDLLRAHRRGVKVTVTIEKYPRTSQANETVTAMLSGRSGLGSGFRSLSPPNKLIPFGKEKKPRLHEKLYCFSHPRPTAFIGSFNPSGDGIADDPAIIGEIGDQDRGHNFLVGLTDPLLFGRLVEHARLIHRAQFIRLYRFSKNANQAVRAKDTVIHFGPRVLPNPVLKFLSRLGTKARIRIAASHINGKFVVKAITGLAYRGAAVEILAEPTLRRVPVEVEEILAQAGISFRRVTHPEGLPMHNKFALVEKSSERWVMFGSFNWTDRSCRFNHEISSISSDVQLFDTFAERWEALATQRD